MADLEAIRGRIGADRMVLPATPGAPRSRPATWPPTAHCRGDPPGPAQHGLGFYAFQFPQSAAARPWADPPPALARLAVPALLIKGSCDYLSWATGVDYLQALPNAQLVYVHHAGHNAYQDQPVAFLQEVRRASRPGRWWTLPWSGDSLPPWTLTCRQERGTGGTAPGGPSRTS